MLANSTEQKINTITLHGLGFPSITRINSSIAVSGLHQDLNHHLTPFSKMAHISLADWTCKYNHCLPPLQSPYPLLAKTTFLSHGHLPKTHYLISTSLFYLQTFIISPLAIFLFVIYFLCPFSFFLMSNPFLYKLSPTSKNMVIILLYPNLVLRSFHYWPLAYPSSSHHLYFPFHLHSTTSPEISPFFLNGSPISLLLSIPFPIPTLPSCFHDPNDNKSPNLP